MASDAHAHLAQMTKMLRNLSGWMDKAEAAGQDLNALLDASLTADMFNLRQQVQASCDGVKFMAARLAGKQAPKHEDSSQSLSELRARIADVTAYAESFSDADFAGADTRLIKLSFLPGKATLGSDFLRQMSLPNTYFHIVMAYAILRQKGVDVGKWDFIGNVPMQDIE